MIRSKIQQILAKTIKKLYKIDFVAVAGKAQTIEKSDDPRHGDYATNIALILSKHLHKSPPLLAKEIVEQLNLHSTNQHILQKIEIAGPGFINFFLSQTALTDNLKNTVSYGAKWPNLKIGRGQTVVIDYSAPNIAKPFGVGHLRSTVIGQAVYNFYQFLGYTVVGDNHLGDWGTQFGKIIYAVKTWGDWEQIKKEPIDALQNLYIKFHQEAEKNPLIEDEARKWFRKLEKGNREARKIWQACVRWSLKEFERIYHILGVKFDLALGESFYQDKMKRVVEECQRKKIAKASQGALAIFYPSGLTPGIIVKSDGATTYLTRDLATLKYRLNRFKPAKVIYHVGNEQALHFRQLFEAGRLLGWLKSITLIHANHGLIRTKEGRFSTRAGKSINLEELLKKSVSKAEKIISKRGSRQRRNKKLAEIIGVGAIKYTDLVSNRKTDVIFDWQKMFSLEGNSAPYLQYAYVRARSILEGQQLDKNPNLSLLDDPIERLILVQLASFEETVWQAAEGQLPNLLADYLYKLAASFNSFYHQLPVLRVGRDLRLARLALVAGFSIVMKKGLSLLGIETPEKM